MTAFPLLKPRRFNFYLFVALLGFWLGAPTGAPGTTWEPVGAAHLSSESAPDWPMAGANPARTSSVSEGVGGMLSARWVKPIEPYISQKVQLIASGGLLYLSTTAGLYALDAASGAEVWVYPTELPLGHSPTVADGVLYVGGFDRKIHAMAAATGAGLWTFKADAGFHTNPLVVNGTVYAGNRDGNMYAVSAVDGRLLWKFETGGPILFSAAYKDGVLYFASNDSHAYALKADDGSLVWKSDKLPGMGFHSFWPVIYEDYVILAGSAAFHGKMHSGERDDLFPDWKSDPDGTLIGPLGTEPGSWAEGMPTIDASKSNEIGSSTPVTAYFEEKPWRRTMFVLDRITGEEVTYDFNGDGRVGYLPALWAGTTGSGNRYPPAVGNDGVLYFRNAYMSDREIAGGGITGWKSGTPFLSLPQSREMGGNGNWPVDEPSAYAVGGNYLYHNLCCDRVVGALDLSQPNPSPPPQRISAGPDNARQWRYRSWQLPGYDSQLLPYLWHPEQSEADVSLYFAHGDQNAPVPYNGMVYVHRSNSVIAFAPGGEGELLPAARAVEPEIKAAPRPVTELKQLLAAEVQKMVSAGHLRPGYSSLGLPNHLLPQIEPNVLDYFHNPADTIVVLLRALPHLPPDMQTRTQAYIQAEFMEYRPYDTRHVGWLEGAARGPVDLPELGRGSWTGRQAGMEPQNYYALWKYAQAFGGAHEMFDQVKDRLRPPPPATELAWNPQRHNAFIAGSLGFLELQKLAGYPESQEVRSELDGLLSLRATTFTADVRHPAPRSAAGKYYYTLLISWNFMHLTPELAAYLHDHALSQVSQAVAEYERLAPYWFVAKAEEVQGEGVMAPLHHYHGLFQAKALILRQPYPELEIYLDVPAFEVGDLFYIDNLVATIEADRGDFSESAEVTPQQDDSLPPATPATTITTPFVTLTAPLPDSRQIPSPLPDPERSRPLWRWFMPLLLALGVTFVFLIFLRKK
jgi:outer membrane protein assembly factor BamB